MSSKIRYYMDVITVLAQKDFKVRYRNSVLGFVWSLLNPLGYMVILTLVFSLLLRVDIPNFASWALIGILIWRFFSIGTAQGLLSIIGNPTLVSKICLPRHIIVLSNNLANLLSAGLEFLVLLPLLVILGIKLTISIFFLPAILAMEFLLIFGISLLLSSINQRYRDFFQLWEMSIQLGFFLCPIVYDATIVPRRFQPLYSLNPVTRLIESARDILLVQRLPSSFDITIIMSSIAISLLIGFFVFKRLEGRFAEEL